MKNILIGLAAATFALTVPFSFAADQSFKPIKGLAIAYASSTGCADDELNPKLVTKYSDKANGIENVYIAVIGSDSECLGGSGTGAATIVVLKTASGREGIDDPTFSYLKVVPELSEPVAKSTAPTRFITSIYQKNGQLFATGNEYAANDSNCCPTLKTIYKIDLLKNVVTLSKDDKRELYTWNFTKVKNY